MVNKYNHYCLITSSLSFLCENGAGVLLIEKSLYWVTFFSVSAYCVKLDKVLIY